MSKSLKIFVPAIGGTILMLGSAYGFAEWSAKKMEFAALQDRIAQVEAHEAKTRLKIETQSQNTAKLAEKITAVREEARAKLVSVPVLLIEPVRDDNAPLNLGRAAHVAEVSAWDIDILPDGRGLPEGKGDVWTGEEVFADRCASCHGDFAEGVDNWPALAGGLDTLGDKDPVKTVGSYWPYLSTVWDYVNRSMPFGEAQTLTPDEVYAITAYILYSNDLVGDDFELSHENFSSFEMHNKNGFVIDDRVDVEYAKWRTEPCMTNCKENVEITMRASVLDVTPKEEMNSANEATETSVVDAGSDVSSELDLVMIAQGKKAFKKCASCHQVGSGAKNRSGPQLNGIVGRTIGDVDGFSYSSVFKTAANEGRVWSHQSLSDFLAKPRDFMKGTKMAFAGLRKEADIKALIAYLETIDAN
ncbi:c-type cytochrome [Rhodobacteraceae bacterium nBUS_24]